ncbi:hypothetical protein ACI797_02645 [Geodermatophilus sp. SYSU D00691]
MKRVLVFVLPALLVLVGFVVIGPSAQAASGVFAARAGTDDAEQQSSGTSVDSSDLELVQDGSQRQTVGLRFPAVTIPPGATVSRAWVQFTADKSGSAPVALTIQGQAADNAPAFSTAAGDVTARPRTTAAVTWSPPSWSSGQRGTAQRTSDVATVVQQVVNRPGWRSGNALVLVVSGTGSAARVAASVETGTARAPALHVEWTTSTQPTPTTPTTSTPPPPAPGPSAGGAAYGFPDCSAGGRSVVRPHPQGTVLTSRWRVEEPPDDTTYDLRGVASIAFPSTSHVFSFGTGSDNLDAGRRTCLIGGELRDQVGYPPPQTWDWYHDNANASCVKGAAYEWYQIVGTRCAGIEDGFRPQEPGVNANNTRFLIAHTYLTNVLDDCLENDYTTAGVVLDSLWAECYTGISERPSSDRCWATPPGEQLVLDRLLMGLRPMEQPEGFGYGRLFKWSKCEGPNQLVIKCSVFFVPDHRLGDADGMDIPAGTVVDDSACPGNPTTIVWLGQGPYPGNLRGLPIRVVTDRGVWDAAVANWKARHGY